MLHLHRNCEERLFQSGAKRLHKKTPPRAKRSRLGHPNVACSVVDTLYEKSEQTERRGGGHITCYSLSLQYEVLPTLPGSMCRRSQRRGGPMELRPESLPSPLHFLVPAQHDYVCVRGWGILLAFIHRPSVRRGVEPPSPWHLLCAVPIKS